MTKAAILIDGDHFLKRLPTVRPDVDSKDVDTIVLVAGDADFVPAAKPARREGVPIILDPLWRRVASDLFGHIDGLRSGFAGPKSATMDEEWT